MRYVGTGMSPARSCWLLILLAVVSVVGGCVQPRRGAFTVDRSQLRRRALECLKAAVHYRHNPAVRISAVEALESSGCEEGLAWVRSALLDEHPAVRFAGCAAVGRTRDSTAESAIRELLADPDASVRVAAIFAWHRLGHQEHTGKLAKYLLHDKDPTVRRNAALVLGFLAEPGAVKLVARAMKDRDEGVRQHALEAMAKLGNHEARQELAFMTAAGVGSDETFAVNALAAMRDVGLADTFRYKLDTAMHVETRLAAARALGLLGVADGYEVALSALQRPPATTPTAQDPRAGQLLRIRQLAANALGAIGRVDALGDLARLLDDQGDPRLQVSMAKAILEIIESNARSDLPFGNSGL